MAAGLRSCSALHSKQCMQKRLLDAPPPCRLCTEEPRPACAFPVCRCHRGALPHLPVPASRCALLSEASEGGMSGAGQRLPGKAQLQCQRQPACAACHASLSHPALHFDYQALPGNPPHVKKLNAPLVPSSHSPLGNPAPGSNNCLLQTQPSASTRVLGPAGRGWNIARGSQRQACIKCRGHDRSGNRWVQLAAECGRAEDTGTQKKQHLGRSTKK